MAIPSMNTKKEQYAGTEQAQKAVANWQLVERIKGAGWGEGLLKSLPELMHLSTNEAVMKVIDTPELLDRVEGSNLAYAAKNATATTLFNRVKSGIITYDKAIAFIGEDAQLKNIFEYKVAKLSKQLAK